MEVKNEKGISRGRIYSLQSLRAIAFIWICYNHMDNGSKLGDNLSLFGVAIFFMLSGFLMTYSYWDRNIASSFKKSISFSFKRISKLYTLHILTMLLYTVLFALIMVKNRAAVTQWGYLVVKLILDTTLMQSWFPSNVVAMSLNGVAWYLSTAMFLYFMFPFILKKIKRIKETKTLVSVGILCIVVQLILATIAFNIKGIDDTFYRWATYTFPIFRLGDFIIGCILGSAYIHRDGFNLNTIRANIYEIMLTVVTVIIVLWQNDSAIGNPRIILSNATTPYMLLALAWVVLFVIKKGIITKVLDNRLLRYIGDISAYTFLIHYVFCLYARTALGVFNIGLPGITKYIFIIFEFIAIILVTMLYLKIKRSFSTVAFKRRTNKGIKIKVEG